jgi:hypothetical protein
MLGCFCAFGVWVLFIGQPASADAAKTFGDSTVEDLGGGQYRIGSISIDKAKGQFSVPGSVVALERPDSPIEFIAVTKGGLKIYEAIFELDGSAVDFNLACILIGLDANHAVQPKQHFDVQKLKGDAVDITVSWDENGTARRVPASDVLRVAGGTDIADEWVYGGSFFSPDGKYIADELGTLVGFVHDPASIIQHVSGLGLGDYGAVTANHDVLPQPGTPVTLQISRSTR